MTTILIVDDEKNIRATLSRSLQLEGYATLEAGDGAAALERLASDEIDLVLLDLQMPLVDGQQVLEEMRRRNLGVPAIVLTAHGTIERAVHAVRSGAFDFVEKPPNLERLLVTIGNALRVSRLTAENRRLREEAGRTVGLLGESAPILALREVIARVGPTGAGVLILGENGTGKELVARAIVEASARRAAPLVTVNAAALPETLFESELFGHARGAFTGAVAARRGKFQLAHGGTLLLDEIGEVPLALQPKLLRALETGEVERVGSETAERVDVRVLAATNRDLEQAIAAGTFRSDLYFRLAVVPVRVPPLRERREDLPLLARHFLEAASARYGLHPKLLGDDALDLLARYDWPGNVRELRNAMERLAILVPGAEIDPEAIRRLVFPTQSGGGSRAATAPPAGPFDLAEELQRLERELIAAVLERNGGRMAASARELGLERSHLYKKLRALGIDRTPES